MRQKSLQKKQLLKTVKQIPEINKQVVSTQEILRKIDSINKTIVETIYVKDNLAVDLKNFSLISITEDKDLVYPSLASSLSRSIS